jgi:ABC-2 type transport system permease protein
MVFVLKIPLIGDWRWYGLVLAALLFTALGAGFVISSASQTDSQAVQYAMIVLLSSVFFSGFMLSLDNLMQPVRLVSWLLPATYGINLLQNIMLRGYFLQPYLIAILTGIGVVLFFLAWLMLGRKLARQ